ELTSYKAESAGRNMILVNPRYTSQQCSQCNTIVKKALSERTHRCPQCGLIMDRDENAALNILALGINGLGANP
ncbi:transposase, partial [Candidatus Pacearchaeota archaeon]|nr:transposase [Candidatus Pacearchaeota archaeon]